MYTILATKYHDTMANLERPRCCAYRFLGDSRAPLSAATAHARMRSWPQGRANDMHGLRPGDRAGPPSPSMFELGTPASLASGWRMEGLLTD